MGAPADLFPGRVWRRLLVQCWDQLTGARGLGRSEHEPLREAIAEHLGTTRGVRCTPDQVIVVSGSQQGIALAASVLLDPDDSVWVEDPGYFGAHTVFAGWGARVVPVAVDDQGLDVEAGRKRAPQARLAHVTPTHQFPLGKTMPLRRRADLLAWAQAADAWILEEDYDSEFRYYGAPLAALQGIDPNQRVIYLGSFSKSMFSGLRMAYLVVPRDLAPAFRAARQVVGGPPPALEQAVVERFLTEGHYQRHLRRMRRVYAQRQGRLVKAIREELDGVLHVDPDETGMHVVGWLRNGMAAEDVCRRAAKEGLDLLPLSSYRAKAGPEGVLLGFSEVGERSLLRGVRLLRKALV
jgi:GntR family transcriptional regulator/MocR family aminotransferase